MRAVARLLTNILLDAPTATGPIPVDVDSAPVPPIELCSFCNEEITDMDSVRFAVCALQRQSSLLWVQRFEKVRTSHSSAS